MEELSGEDLLWFVSAAYNAQATNVFESLNVTDLNLQNVWDVFHAILSTMMSLL